MPGTRNPPHSVGKGKPKTGLHKILRHQACSCQDKWCRVQGSELCLVGGLGFELLGVWLRLYGFEAYGLYNF